VAGEKRLKGTGKEKSNERKGMSSLLGISPGRKGGGNTSIIMGILVAPHNPAGWKKV